MLANVTPKKARRKKAPKPPQAIDEATWRNIEAAICIGGLGYSECGRKFNVSPHAIIMRANVTDGRCLPKSQSARSVTKDCYKSRVKGQPQL